MTYPKKSASRQGFSPFWPWKGGIRSLLWHQIKLRSWNLVCRLGRGHKSTCWWNNKNNVDKILIFLEKLILKKIFEKSLKKFQGFVNICAPRPALAFAGFIHASPPSYSWGVEVAFWKLISGNNNYEKSLRGNFSRFLDWHSQILCSLWKLELLS